MNEHISCRVLRGCTPSCASLISLTVSEQGMGCREAKRRGRALVMKMLPRRWLLVRSDGRLNQTKPRRLQGKKKGERDKGPTGWARSQSFFLVVCFAPIVALSLAVGSTARVAVPCAKWTRTRAPLSVGHRGQRAARRRLSSLSWSPETAPPAPALQCGPLGTPSRVEYAVSTVWQRTV